MSNIIIKFCLIVISFIFLTSTVKCYLQKDVKFTVEELQERNRRLYEDVRKRPIKEWELDVEDALSYPNGDKQKLAAISQLWSEYYYCTSLVVDSLAVSGRLPSVNVIAYGGSTARLPCGLCVAPGEQGDVTWFYAESIQNVTFTSLGEKSTLVSNVNLTIYNVQSKDAGVYGCRLGSSVGGLVVLEVLDDEQYDTNLQPDWGQDSQSLVSTNLIVFTAWSAWSECSRCNHIGARRRYGMCFVRLNNKNFSNFAQDKSKTTTKGNHESNDETLKIFQEFPSGIGCRSKLLPDAYRNNPTINAKKNYIIAEPCKVPCKEFFEIRSKTGKLIERANNSGGVYSLNQRAPPQPPDPVRDIVFVEHGDTFTLICPGTTLRDIPITWRIGTKYFDVSTIGKEAIGRIQLTSRDHIVFSSVEYYDSNVYSCWQSLNLAGVIKLQVWRDARFVNGRPAAVISLIVVIIALRFAIHLLRSKLRRIH